MRTLYRWVIRRVIRKEQIGLLMKILWEEVDEYYFAPPTDRYFGINDYLMDEYKKELEKDA